MAAAYKIPVRFKRVAAVFDSEVARARLCESSGSEHSPPADQSLTDLSDLVNSFLEREYCYNCNIEEIREVDGDINNEKLTVESDEGFSETREILQDLFRNQSNNHLREAVENVLPEIMTDGISFSASIPPDYKRRLMSLLRRRGFDAGICKSKWEKSGHCPSGSYEYIDILISGNRYIIEVCLGREFDIAKPIRNYSALLKMFPIVLVCKNEEMKQVTRLMCVAMKKSMKSSGLNVPPWRRLAYTQSKWFSSYRRTVNEFPTDLNKKSMKNNSDDDDRESIRKKRSVGFRPPAAGGGDTIAFRCREEEFFGTKMLATKVGYLALALNGHANNNNDQP